MSEDCRVTLADAEREVWEHTPYEAVGPLRFGVGREEAVDVMAELGFTSSERQIVHFTRKEWCVEFRRSVSGGRRPAVKAYFNDPVGMTCLLVDGLCGPQVTCEGIRLIGRVPSELDAELEARAEEEGRGIWFSPSGDLGWPEYGFDRGSQCAGDSVVSWASFHNTMGIAGTSHDITPREVWEHW